MNNHQYFYICCVHEYCWNRCFSSTFQLVAVRSILCLMMAGLITAEVVVFDGIRFRYFSNWGSYLTMVVTVLQLACAIKYKVHLDKFNLQLKNI